MSPMYTEAATLAAASRPESREAVRSTALKPRVQFWSLILMICVFLGHGAWVLSGIAGQSGLMERPVILALLGFYASSLPGCIYFAAREYRKLKKSSR